MGMKAPCRSLVLYLKSGRGYFNLRQYITSCRGDLRGDMCRLCKFSDARQLHLPGESAWSSCAGFRCYVTAIGKRIEPVRSRSIVVHGLEGRAIRNMRAALPTKDCARDERDPLQPAYCGGTER